MSRAYSSTVRSLENLPIRATFRIAFWAQATGRMVVAIESGWLQRLQSCRLHCYHFSSDTFDCLDECAGYFVSRVPVVPRHVEPLDDPVAELGKRGVSLRLESNLWPLRDAVVASSLQFSMIRMRNALPRDAA